MKKLIVANWKMNPKTLKEAQKLVLAVSKTKTQNTVVVCPPFVYLPVLKTKLILGSQDIFWQSSGPFTSQISADMLKQFKVKYAITGHSERRALGETDNEVNLKVKAAIGNKIIPILLRVKNIDSLKKALFFTSGQKFDVSILNSSRAEVWRWSKGRIFTMAIEEIPLKSQEETFFETKWKQNDFGGQIVSPGIYYVIGK
ncbi:MAG: triose-phosphate isomerase, partial [Patescibacteria group bacterium]